MRLLALPPAMAIALVACSTPQQTRIPYASPNEQPGYPVFVGMNDGSCTYQVQDMIFDRDERLASWMTKLRDKSQRIDIVRPGPSDTCVQRAFQILKDAGFAKIYLRKSGTSYPNGLIPGS